MSIKPVAAGAMQQRPTTNNSGRTHASGGNAAAVVEQQRSLQVLDEEDLEVSSDSDDEGLDEGFSLVADLLVRFFKNIFSFSIIV